MGKFILSKFVIFGLLFTKDGFRGIQICQKQAEILLSSQKFSSNSSPLNNLINFFFLFWSKKDQASKSSCLKKVMSQKCHVSKRLLLQTDHVSKMSCLKEVIVANRSCLKKVIVANCLYLKMVAPQKVYFCNVIMSQKGHSSKQVIHHNDRWLLGAPDVERYFFSDHIM